MAWQSLCWFSRQSLSLSSVKVNRCSKIETVCKKENQIINDDEDNDDNLCKGDLLRTRMPTFCQEVGSKMGPRTCSASGLYSRAKHCQAVWRKEIKKKEKTKNWCIWGKTEKIFQSIDDRKEATCGDLTGMGSRVGLQCHMPRSSLAILS